VSVETPARSSAQGARD